MVKKAAAVVVVLVILSLAVGCGTPAPTRTPTPQPTGTPVEVLATKGEHLVGIWFDGDSYGRYEADGTITWAESMANLNTGQYCQAGRFWFEDGIYYEESFYYEGAFGCEPYLRIEEGRAVRLRLHVVEVPEQPSDALGMGRDRILVRVD
jgi:hypothetical protein